MSEPFLYSKNTSSDYENFYADCPYCGFSNIFNRVSDLKTLAPISFQIVKCLSKACSHKFNINGDSASEAYETLIHDCNDLLERKKYSSCILNLTQAYEVFFNLFVYLKLVGVPFSKEEENSDIDVLNNMSRDLRKAIRNFGYRSMRNLFFNFVIKDIKPQNIVESHIWIGEIHKFGGDLNGEEFKKIDNLELRKLILSIKNSKIEELRNNIAHKYAYKATEDEARKMFKETRTNLLIDAQRILNIDSMIFDSPL